MDMREIRYQFHTEWCEDAGQFYAALHEFDASTDARKAHGAALGFLWATGKLRPSVSDLFAITVDKDPTTGRSQTYARDTIANGQTRASRQQPLA
jgi:hypothetical protein